MESLLSNNIKVIYQYGEWELLKRINELEQNDFCKWFTNEFKVIKKFLYKICKFINTSEEIDYRSRIKVRYDKIESVDAKFNRFNLVVVNKSLK